VTVRCGLIEVFRKMIQIFVLEARQTVAVIDRRSAPIEIVKSDVATSAKATRHKLVHRSDPLVECRG
jgi:hypothetical protein